MSEPTASYDEYVSAYLDGEATPAEAAAVEQDPALGARLEELRAVRDAVAEPLPEVDDALREANIAAALAAADVSDVADAAGVGGVVGDADAATGAGGVVLAFRTASKPLLAVAAAVIAVGAVIGVGILADRFNDDESQLESATMAFPEAAGEAASEADEPTDAEASDAMSTPMASLPPPTTFATSAEAEDAPAADMADDADMAVDVENQFGPQMSDAADDGAAMQEEAPEEAPVAEAGIERGEVAVPSIGGQPLDETMAPPEPAETEELAETLDPTEAAGATPAPHRRPPRGPGGATYR